RSYGDWSSDVCSSDLKKLREKAVWEKGKPVPADYHAWLKQNVAERQVAKEQPDPAARAKSARSLRASYTKPAISHASIGPSCAQIGRASCRERVESAG